MGDFAKSSPRLGRSAVTMKFSEYADSQLAKFSSVHLFRGTLLPVLIECVQVWPIYADGKTDASKGVQRCQIRISEVEGSMYSALRRL